MDSTVTPQGVESPPSLKSGTKGLRDFRVPELLKQLKNSYTREMNREAILYTGIGAYFPWSFRRYLGILYTGREIRYMICAINMTQYQDEHFIPKYLYFYGTISPIKICICFTPSVCRTIIFENFPPPSLRSGTRDWDSGDTCPTPWGGVTV